MLIFIWILLPLLRVTIVASQNVFQGRCPARAAADLINLKEIHGTWYETDRSAILAEFALKCVSIRVQQFFNQEAHVMIKAKNRITKKKIRELIAVRAEPDFYHSGRLSLTGQAEPDAISGLEHYTYQILSTDYKNYMILWGCQTFVSAAHSESLWILSRTHRLDPDVSSNVTEQIQSMGLSHLKLQSVPQTNCN